MYRTLVAEKVARIVRHASGRGVLWLGASFACAATLTGCAVKRPPGYPQDDDRGWTARAAPGKMFGMAPTSWDLPDGRRATIDVARARVSSGVGSYEADFAFAARLDGKAIRCSTSPPKLKHETRFGCWSTGHTLEFAIGPDLRCPAGGAAYRTTLTSPACWQGALVIGGKRFELRHGTLESSGAPVGYISWLDARGSTLICANTVTDMQVRVVAESSRMPKDLRDTLVLLTIALSYWEHASSGS